METTTSRSSPLTNAAINAAPVLRALADHGPISGHLEVAARSGQPAKNMLRTLENLTRDGLVALHLGEGYSLTAAGRRARLALDVADGLAEPAADAEAAADPEAGLLLRHDQMRPNPLQPRKHFDRQRLDELKASIAADLAAGGPGVLQNLVVFPADAEGVHVISAGEYRWRAVGELIAEGVWPEGRRLRAIARANTPGHAAFIGLVENGQRTDLTLIEQARAYTELCAETGWSGREAALKTGRDERTVQEMLKVVREASAEDIAAHEADPKDFTWERLRDSVKAHKTPEAAPEPAQADIEEARFEAPPAKPPATGPILGGGGGSGGARLRVSGPDVELTPAAALALVEMAWKLQNGGADGAAGAYWTQVRRYWLDVVCSVLKSEHGFIDFSHAFAVGGPHAEVTWGGWRWLEAHGYERGEITEDQVQAARIAAGIPDHLAARDDVFATPWLNVDDEAKAAAPAEPAAEIADDEDDPEALAEAEATLAEIRERLDEPAAFAELARRAGLSLPLSVGGDGGILDAVGLEIATVDVNRETNDALVLATTMLFVRAFNRACDASAREAKGPDALFALHAGDVVSIGGEASGYRLLSASDAAGHHSPNFIAQQVSLKTGKDIGSPRGVTLHAIQRVIRRATARADDEGAAA